jgi:transcriptional regulator with XRE-family HTH domain
MDDKWFKAQQKRAGVTAEDIARRAGKARSNVSNILTGRQGMSLEWAQVFAEVLQVPLDEVLKRAGVLEEPKAQQLQPGFSNSDALPFTGQGEERTRALTPADALGRRAGVDVWQVRTTALAQMGYLPGDFLLVDTHQSERARQGDVVVAQVYDNHKGTAHTILRRLEPPVLVAASCNPDHRRVHVLDGVNVVVRGKVTAMWRV